MYIYRYSPLEMASTSWITTSLYNYNQWQLNAGKPYQPYYMILGNFGQSNYGNFATNPYSNTINVVDLKFNQPLYNNTVLPFGYNLTPNIYANNNKFGFNSYYKPNNLFTKNTYNLTNNEFSNYQKTNNNTATKATNNKPKTKKSENNQVTIQEDLRSEFLTTASKYEGCNEKDGSWRQISNSKEWCADFITHVVNETYNDNGYQDLKGFTKKKESPHMRVEEIKQWGITNDKYLDLSKSSNEAKEIKQNVKKGDIMILRENGASHTGFVSKILADGSFETIEGNRDDKVTKYKYNPNDDRLSGFVQLA